MGRKKGSKNQVKPIDITKQYPKKTKIAILRAIENAVSLYDLYESNPKVYPHPTIVGHWIENDVDFAKQMADAKRVLAHTLVEKLHQMQNNPPRQDDFILPTKIKVGKDINVVPAFNESAFKLAVQIWTKQLSSIQNEIKDLGSIFNDKYTKINKIDQAGRNPMEQVIILNYKDLIEGEIAPDALPPPKDKS